MGKLLLSCASLKLSYAMQTPVPNAVAAPERLSAAPQQSSSRPAGLHRPRIAYELVQGRLVSALPVSVTERIPILQ